ncbi:MAG: hypothetical protein AB1489_37665 [Acidobacteriota bacterium]
MMKAEPNFSKTWADVLSNYSRHAEDCEEYNDFGTGKLLGGCNHLFVYTCQCGQPVEISGFNIAQMQADDHVDSCYACCGCDVCRRFTIKPQA